MSSILDKPIAGNSARPLSEKQRIELWLQQYGFAYNPFAFTDSERDYRLSEYFVEHPDFEKTIGLNHRLVFARPGDGKTAIRLRLQSLYRDAFGEHHVFAFSYLVPQEIAATPPPTIDKHLNELLTAAVRHAFVLLALRGVEFPLLQQQLTDNSISALFAAFFEEYYGVINSWQADLQQAIDDYSLEQTLHNLDPVYDDLEPFEATSSINKQWLQQWRHLLTAAQRAEYALPLDLFERWRLFCDLLKRIGVQDILILVDGVDIKPTDRHALDGTPIERMAAIVTPLLQAIAEDKLGKNIYWKLFLPFELYLPLIAVLPFQVQYDIIEWDRKRLFQFLRSRLSSASNGAVTSLNQLVSRDVIANLELYLCAASESSPRYLMHYINKIFALHLSTTTEEHLPGKLSSHSLARIPYIAHRLSGVVAPP